LAIITAIALPVVALAAVGGVQIATVVNIRAKTQSIADSAALMGAEQLSVVSAGATNRAQTWAEGQLAALFGDAATTFTATAMAPDSQHIQVTITTSTPSFFGPDLPAGGFKTTVTATAESVAQSPLCLLVLARVPGMADLALAGSSSIAASCTVYSNNIIFLDAGARITDLGTEAGGTVMGFGRNNIGPAAPQTGSPPVSNPFPLMTYAGVTGTGPPGPCIIVPRPVTSGIVQPGNYCNGIEVAPGAQITLASGEYQFGGPLTIGNGAVITGSDVVLFFGFHSSAHLSSSAQISLAGRRTGPHAGFVLITTHSPQQAAIEEPFVIPTDAFSSITGTVYSPNIPLQLQGGTRAAQSSDWTVIVANALSLAQRPGATSYPSIQMNANYAGSAVPVPSGVGPVGSTRLVQ
jgi:Flp pilus assembly protein TadG